MESQRTMGREWAGPRIGTPHTGLRTEERFRRWRSRSIYSGKSKLRRTTKVYLMTLLQASVGRHICSSRKSAVLPKAAKEPASKNLFKTRQSLNQTAFLYQDNLKTAKPNSDGALINYLRLPFAARTTSLSAPKVLRANSFQLIKFWCTRTVSSTRDKVNRAAGRPAPRRPSFLGASSRHLIIVRLRSKSAWLLCVRCLGTVI